MWKYLPTVADFQHFLAGVYMVILLCFSILQYPLPNSKIILLSQKYNYNLPRNLQYIGT